MAGLAPDYLSYPQGDAAADATSWVVDTTGGSGGLVQEIGVRRSFEIYSLCTWTGTWLDPSASGTEHDEAVVQITGAADWPALTATDGGGVVDAVRALGTAAQSQDRAGALVQAQRLCPQQLVGEE